MAQAGGRAPLTRSRPEPRSSRAAARFRQSHL